MNKGTYDGQLLDITGAGHVEIMKSKNVLWINVDGLCRLRICRIQNEIELTNIRIDKDMTKPEIKKMINDLNTVKDSLNEALETVNDITLELEVEAEEPIN